MILMQWDKISSICLLKVHVKDMLVYASTIICPVRQNMKVVGSI